MLIPIRCFSCNTLLSNKWTDYVDKVKKYSSDNSSNYDVNTDNINEEMKETAEFKAMRDLNIKRSCCRRHFLCTIDLIDDV